MIGKKPPFLSSSSFLILTGTPLSKVSKTEGLESCSTVFSVETRVSMFENPG